MYSINGVALDNPTLGWSVQAQTRALIGVSRRITNLEEPGRDGNTRLPVTTAPSRIRLVVRTPRSNLGALLALLGSTGDPYIALTSNPARRAIFELLDAVPVGLTASDELVEVEALLSLPGVYWRDTNEVTLGPVAIGNAVQDIDVLPGITAPVADAMIYIGGAFDDVEFRDASGAWVRTIKAWVGSGSGLLYLAATGQAYRVNTSAPWTPVTDVSDGIDTSGGPGFVITPRMVGSDPTNTKGTIRVTTTQQTGVQVRVRARGAYLVP